MLKTIRVSRKLFANYRSIQQAIMDADAGCRIEVEPGVYKEELYINKYIEIVGIGDEEKPIIQGIERPTVYMAAGYAVLKNLTLKQPRKRGLDTVYIPDGALVIEDSQILARWGAGVIILGDESEPIFRRCEIYSERNVAIEFQNQGKVILEDCHLSTGDFASILIREGNPIFRRCTITGDEGYGVYVEDRGRGFFEDCNIYGFDYSPAIGILRGNPHFVRCRIHDCQDYGVVIEEGRGRFQNCHFFSFDKKLAAVRLFNRAQPRFEKCIFQNCNGGAFLIEQQASGLIEDCDCFGFTHEPAVTIKTDAHPQFIRCQIHDGNNHGVVCTEGGKGFLESSQVYSFNQHVISITNLSQLDLLRCQIRQGNSHGIFIAQKSKGIFQDTKIEQFPHLAAIHVTQAGHPKVIQCRISQSFSGVKVTENGHGLFEKCVFSEIEHEVWEIKDGNPQIHLCTEEGKSDQEDSKASEEPLNVSLPIQKWLHQLSQVIGQEQVKKDLREFILYLDYLQDRKQLGIKTLEQPDLNAFFLGPSQTGKQRVAEIYGELLKELGYLSRAEMTVISVENDLLTDQGIDQEIWLSKINQLNGGLLFIHEIPKLEKSILKEQLLPLMKTFLDTSKNFGNTVVILSLGEKGWKKWCKLLPAFTPLRRYHFEDYLPEEMAQLFQWMAKKEDYIVHLTARDKLMREMTHLWNLEDGKKHLERVRDYFEQVKVVHSLRCSKLPKHERTKEVLTTIMPEDLTVKEKKELRPDQKEWVKNIRKK